MGLRRAEPRPRATVGLWHLQRGPRLAARRRTAVAPGTCAGLRYNRWSTTAVPSLTLYRCPTDVHNSHADGTGDAACASRTPAARRRTAVGLPLRRWHPQRGYACAARAAGSATHHHQPIKALTLFSPRSSMPGPRSGQRPKPCDQNAHRDVDPRDDLGRCDHAGTVHPAVGSHRRFEAFTGEDQARSPVTNGTQYGPRKDRQHERDDIGETRG